MEQKVLVPLLILLLGFSCVLSSSALPRSLKLMKTNPSFQEIMGQELSMGAIEVRYDRELQEVEDGFIHGRMDFEKNDYPGTGANGHHDPQPPGKD